MAFTKLGEYCFFRGEYQPLLSKFLVWIRLAETLRGPKFVT
jgi:hypothetical protein